jgi:hypothetical protein
MSEPDTIVKNAVQCKICGAGADLINKCFYQCQANSNHLGDTWVGIFTDMTFEPEEDKK